MCFPVNGANSIYSNENAQISTDFIDGVVSWVGVVLVCDWIQLFDGFKRVIVVPVVVFAV